MVRKEDERKRQKNVPLQGLGAEAVISNGRKKESYSKIHFHRGSNPHGKDNALAGASSLHGIRWCA